MQVARNYFLTLDQTFIRKFTEILLALQIEARLSKEEIFELYVNRVFLGHRAYGFEAAAETYYGKSLAELDLAQHAMLAGVPKAPSRNNPLSNPEKGKIRRDWILGRMENLGMITEAERDAAMATPMTVLFLVRLLRLMPTMSPKWSGAKWWRVSVTRHTTTAMSFTPPSMQNNSKQREMPCWRACEPTTGAMGGADRNGASHPVMGKPQLKPLTAGNKRFRKCRPLPSFSPASLPRSAITRSPY
ncbi:MAG: transglycosylase domain-containing protein [Luminiphilus sp.]